MKRSRILAALLAFVLIVSAFAGCAQTSTDSSDKESSTSSKEDKEESKDTESSSDDASEEMPTTGTYPIPGAEGMSLTYWMPLHSNVFKYLTDYADCEVYQEMFKRMGVSYDFIHPTYGEEKTQLTLLVNSGEFPDIVQQKWFYPGGTEASVADGFTIDLTPYLEQYAPDYYNLIMTNEKAYRSLTSAEGMVSCIAGIQTDTTPWKRNNLNMDVMAECGLTEIPKTIDDYTAAFAEMAKKGILGYALPSNGYDNLMTMPYDVITSFQLNENGEVIYGDIQDGMKEYLMQMNEWYEAGYISKDFMSMDVDAGRALFETNKLAIFPHATDVILSSSRANGYGFEPLEYPRLEEGQQLKLDSMQNSVIDGHKATVTTACENPEIAIQALNYCFTEEGSLLANFGIEGKSWEWVDDEPTFTDYVKNNDKYTTDETMYMLKLHWSTRLVYPDVLANPSVACDDEGAAVRMKYADDDKIDCSMLLPALTLETEATAERAALMTDIETYVNESRLQFITGVKSFDEWDDYVAQVEKMGIARAVELTQDAYTVYSTKEYPGT